MGPGVTTEMTLGGGTGGEGRGPWVPGFHCWCWEPRMGVPGFECSFGSPPRSGLGNSVLGVAAVAWEWVGLRVQVEHGHRG